MDYLMDMSLDLISDVPGPASGHELAKARPK